MVEHTCNPSTQKLRLKDHEFQATLSTCWDYLKCSNTCTHTHTHTPINNNKFIVSKNWYKDKWMYSVLQLNSIHLSPVSEMDKSSRQKISDVAESNNTIKQLDRMAIHRLLHPNNSRIHSSQAHMEYSWSWDALSHKICLSKVRRIEIIQCLLSEIIPERWLENSRICGD
jgi:hypothetical protein